MIRRYATTALLLLIAIHQIVLVYSAGLTRWRGGGFGMYSADHPAMRRVWVEFLPGSDAAPPGTAAGGRWRLPMGGEEYREFRRLEWAARTLPNHRNLMRIGDTLAGLPGLAGCAGLAVEVWGEEFDPETTTLERRLVDRLEVAGRGLPGAPCGSAG